MSEPLIPNQTQFAHLFHIVFCGSCIICPFLTLLGRPKEKPGQMHRCHETVSGKKDHIDFQGGSPLCPPPMPHRRHCGSAIMTSTSGQGRSSSASGKKRLPPGGICPTPRSAWAGSTPRGGTAQIVLEGRRVNSLSRSPRGRSGKFTQKDTKTISSLHFS